MHFRGVNFSEILQLAFLLWQTSPNLRTALRKKVVKVQFIEKDLLLPRLGPSHSLTALMHTRYDRCTGGKL